MKPEVEFMVGPFLDGEVKLCLLAKPKCKLHYYLQVADEMIHQCRRKRRYKKKKKKQFSESFHFTTPVYLAISYGSTSRL